MTEAEWLACEDASVVFEYIVRQAGARKVRLALCNVLRAPTVWSRLAAPTSRVAVEVGEAFADGTASQQQLGRSRKRANDAARREWRKVGGYPPPAASNLASYVCYQDRNLLTASYLGRGYLKQLRPPVELFREVFGNPFRPVIFDAVWRTTDVMLLAQGIYKECAFDRMPILADALQDAGCDDAVVLNHCRSGGVHVRGCWVVDLALGKE